MDPVYARRPLTPGWIFPFAPSRLRVQRIGFYTPPTRPVHPPRHHPSHACEHVATGRLNPLPSDTSCEQNIRTSDSNVPPPGAHAEGSDVFAPRTQIRAPRTQIRATRVSKWQLDARTRFPPTLVVSKTSAPATPMSLHPALTLRAPMCSLREHKSAFCERKSEHPCRLTSFLARLNLR